MLKLVGSLLICTSLILLYGSFQKMNYDSFGNITDTRENTYAITDAIGVEYFVKENYLFIPDQVFIFISSSLFFGLLLLASKDLDFLSRSKISIPSLSIGIILIFMFFYSIIKYRGTHTFFHDRISLLFAGFITLLVFSLFNKFWKIIAKNILLSFILFYAYLQIGVSLFIELGNYFQPFFHEGNWGQIDGNYIAIFWNDTFKHSWTYGYITFRYANLLLLLICINFAIRSKNFSISLNKIN